MKDDIQIPETEEQSPQPISKISGVKIPKKIYWKTTLLCLITLPLFCIPIFGMIFLMVATPLVFVYLLYQVDLIIKNQPPSFRGWRLNKISLWIITIMAGFATQYYLGIRAQTEGNQFVQKVEDFKQSHGHYPQTEEEIAYVQAQIPKNTNISYMKPDSAEGSWPMIFYIDPNMVFHTCHYRYVNKTWECGE